MTAECMNGTTGKAKHERFTPADYVVGRKSATADDHMCRQCLLVLLRSKDRADVHTVWIYRQPSLQYDRLRHDEVLALFMPRKSRAVIR